MNIVIVEDTISLADLKEIGKEFYDGMVKGVVDVEQEVVAFGGEYHIDANMKLIEHGSSQPDIWGFNVYVDRPRESWIEYISMINIRPAAGNMEMEVRDQKIRDLMKTIVEKRIA